MVTSLSSFGMLIGDTRSLYEPLLTYRLNHKKHMQYISSSHTVWYDSWKRDKAVESCFMINHEPFIFLLHVNGNFQEALILNVQHVRVLPWSSSFLFLTESTLGFFITWLVNYLSTTFIPCLKGVFPRFKGVQLIRRTCLITWIYYLISVDKHSQFMPNSHSGEFLRGGIEPHQKIWLMGASIFWTSFHLQNEIINRTWASNYT